MPTSLALAHTVHMLRAAAIQVAPAAPTWMMSMMVLPVPTLAGQVTWMLMQMAMFLRMQASPPVQRAADGRRRRLLRAAVAEALEAVVAMVATAVRVARRKRSKPRPTQGLPVAAVMQQGHWQHVLHCALLPLHRRRRAGGRCPRTRTRPCPVVRCPRTRPCMALAPIITCNTISSSTSSTSSCSLERS